MMLRFKRQIKRLLLNAFYRRLGARIGIVLFLIVTIPVVSLGFLLITTSRQAMREEVLNNHKEIARRCAGEIELFLRRPRDILIACAGMLGVSYPAAWKQETILVELVLNQPVFIRASSFDLSGAEIAGSELGASPRWDNLKEMLRDVTRGRSYVSGVKVLDNHLPFLTIAVPIKKLGKAVGMLAGDVDIKGVWEITDSIKIGESGKVFLVSDDGTLIAHQDKKRVLRNENLSGLREVREVLAAKTDALELDDPREGRLISSYAPVKGPRWGVVLRQRQDEAYLFLRRMMLQSWIILILSELAAVMASMFMAKALSGAIKDLSAKMQGAASGDFEQRIKTGVRDDIGELIRSFNEMSKKLKKARERERFSAIGEAASWITHELKNSFVSIKSFIQLFPQRHRDEKFVHKFSSLLPGEIQRLDRMFRELSDFSSNYELNIDRVDLGGLLRDILEMMKEEFAQKKILVNYGVYCAAVPNVSADTQRLKQLFVNLILNAINAMPEGGSLTISVLDAPEHDFSGGKGYVEVRIKDSGTGMSEETRERIFEPFRTTKTGGMGLGLTISRKIVQEHGGSIEVESSLGAGATFTVSLPKTSTSRWT